LLGLSGIDGVGFGNGANTIATIEDLGEFFVVKEPIAIQVIAFKERCYLLLRVMESNLFEDLHELLE